MATYYWTGAVNGGTGTWDASSTTNWSSSSGGTGGAGPPTAADAVIFDASSGAGVCTLGANVDCLSINLSAYTGTLAFGTNRIRVAGNNAQIVTTTATFTATGEPIVELTYSGATGTRTVSCATLTTEANTLSIYVSAGTDTVSITRTIRDINFTGFSGTWTRPNTLNCYGGLILSSGMTVSAATFSISLLSTNASDRILNGNGNTLDCPLVFGAAGNWRLTGDFYVASGRQVTHTLGTIKLDGFKFRAGTWASSNSNTRTLSFGSGGALEITASSFAVTVTNLTVSGTGTIDMSSASAKTFAGGGGSYPVLNQGGAGTLTISGSNTFTSITNTVASSTISFTSGTTQTVSTLGLAGTAGNLITLVSSSAGSRATLTSTTPSISVSYASIKDISATGGADWYALNSTDAGNNLGWFFNPSLLTSNETPFALRSFSERRAF